MAEAKPKPEITGRCVACGCCVKACPLNAITVHRGMRAVADEEKCVGCGRCAGACPALAIVNVPAVVSKNNKKDKRWYDYLWIVTPVYFTLGFFNILFAWLGLIFFCTPLLIAIIGGNKSYCNIYCDRGQFFEIIGGRAGVSFKKNAPRFLGSTGFRYGFLAFFMTMFGLMLYNTYLVFAGAGLKEAVKLFWTFDVPWHWTNTSFVTPGVAQFAFGFDGVMLTATLIGLITMIFLKPRTWCVYCPMGTMTHGICKIKARGK